MIINYIFSKSQRNIQFILLAFLILFVFQLQAQNKEILHFEYPEKDTIYNNNSPIVFGGNVTEKGKLFINGNEVKIYKTGSFVYKSNPIQVSQENIEVAFISQKDTIKRIFYILPEKTKTEQILKNGEVKIIKITPENPQEIRVGEILTATIEAQHNSDIYFFNSKIHLTPISKNLSSWIYQGVYTIQPSDTNSTNLLSGTNKNGNNTIEFHSDFKPKIIQQDKIITGKTFGKYAYMIFGDGDDRLGGAKMSYLDSNILVHVVEKNNDLYKIALTQNRFAYIPTDHLKILPTTTDLPQTLSSNINVYPTANYDEIKISLDKRLPYNSTTELDPNKLKISIFGLTSNTNWITQMENLKSIKNVYYEQSEDKVFTIIVDLKTAINWGYDIHYDNNNLIIQIKHAPKSRKWKDITIGIDAGHGGSNIGANGLSGVLEKDITLQVALLLEKKLKHLGANVVITRRIDTTLSMTDRIDYLKSKQPNLVISLHCNSASPFVKGNSTYYRYIGFRPLSRYIHNSMLGLGLENYGNVGSFNFGLNGPTQFINALNELAFISNPEEEEKLVDKKFQLKMVDAMTKGIQQFLKDYASKKIIKKKFCQLKIRTYICTPNNKGSLAQLV